VRANTQVSVVTTMSSTTADDTADDTDDEIVTTAGVTSHVFEGDDGDEIAGHVLLLDLDDAALIDAVKVADDLEGVAAVLQSSAGSFHVWGLSVSTFREQTIRAMSYHDGDDKHVGSSWRRGYAVLRVTGKLQADGETYKERPTVCHVSPSGADGPHSAAHAAMLRSLIREQPEPPKGVPSALSPSEAPEGVEYIGDVTHLRLDSYHTLTDDGKEAVRHA
jgi:hypothetical protein